MGGAFGGLTLIDCSECAGFNVPLTFGVVGAGVGAAIGAVIDTLHGSAAASPQRQPRLQLSPLMGRGRSRVDGLDPGSDHRQLFWVAA